MRIKDIAAARIRYGQRRIYVLLRREGWHVNIKRVARIYRAEGLAIRTKTPRRRRAPMVREAIAQPTAAWERRIARRRGPYRCRERPSNAGGV